MFRNFERFRIYLPECHVHMTNFRTRHVSLRLACALARRSPWQCVPKGRASVGLGLVPAGLCYQCPFPLVAVVTTLPTSRNPVLLSRRDRHGTVSGLHNHGPEPYQSRANVVPESCKGRTGIVTRLYGSRARGPCARPCSSSVGVIKESCHGCHCLLLCLTDTIKNLLKESRDFHKYHSFEAALHYVVYSVT